MMKLDTKDVPGWENRIVVLEFQHLPLDTDGSRTTVVRLVEHQPTPPGGWIEHGEWRRKVCEAEARCSPLDQFCRETGRRVAIRRLAALHSFTGGLSSLVRIAIRQYFENRTALRRGQADG